MISFLIGLVVGAGVVGSSVKRTIDVEHGNIRGAIGGSVLNSVTYFYSIYAIAREDYWGYLGTAVGSTIIVAWMAHKNRKTK